MLHVGHCHSHVVAAICKQAAALNTHTRYLHDGILDYMERLMRTFNHGITSAIMVCTGSKANDIVLRMAQVVTGKTGTIATNHTCHGQCQDHRRSHQTRFADACGKTCHHRQYLRAVLARRMFQLFPSCWIRMQLKAQCSGLIVDAFPLCSAISCRTPATSPPRHLQVALEAYRKQSFGG